MLLARNDDWISLLPESIEGINLKITTACISLVMTTGYPYSQIPLRHKFENDNCLSLTSYINSLRQSFSQ